MGYSIRKATDNDKEILIGLWKKIINTNFPSFMSYASVQRLTNSGMINKEITDRIDDTIVLEQKNEIIGLCIWKDNLLYLFMIDPKYQGSGAASYFIEKVSNVKLLKHEEVYLESFEYNLRANGFYRKSGWKAVGRELDKEENCYRLLYKKTKG